VNEVKAVLLIMFLPVGFLIICLGFSISIDFLKREASREVKEKVDRRIENSCDKILCAIFRIKK
jgi:hypothetical protein